MFALEIKFNDGSSKTEVAFVRRPNAIVGAGESAHVLVDGLEQLGHQLMIVRSIGRQFSVKPIAADQEARSGSLLEGVYDGRAVFDLGPVSLQLTALDLDLLLCEREPPDRAGVRVLRQACACASPVFPALFVPELEQLAISFTAGQPLYVGRSKACQLRLDAPSVSNTHARVGFESGQFWVEDLGSTNGTFIGQQQISGRAAVPPGEAIVLARQVRLIGVTAQDQLRRLRASAYQHNDARLEQRYPALVSISESVRPARVVLVPGSSVSIGRDPAGEMWLGAPHVSRKHCAVMRNKTGTLLVTDHSTNGTSYDLGVLRNGDSIEIDGQPQVLDFGGGITVAICFNEGQEHSFISSGGRPDAFRRRSLHAALNVESLRQVHALSDAIEVEKSKFSALDPMTGRRTGLLGLFRSLPIIGKIVFFVVCGLGLFLGFLFFLLVLGRFSVS